MKKILVILTLAACSTVFSQVEQNEDEKTTTTTTKTYVEDDKGVEVQTKQIKTTESQDLALTNFDGKHNFSTEMKPLEIKSDVVYSSNDVDYIFKQKENNYIMLTKTDSDVMSTYATLIPSTQKGYYILTRDGDSSFGYFNQNGHFVVESYDEENHKIVSTVYVLGTATKVEILENKMK